MKPDDAALAEALRRLGDDDTCLADALGLAPEVLEQLVDKAVALAEHGRPLEAEALLARLCLVDTRSALLPLVLGGVRADVGDHAGALVAYSESLRRHTAALMTPPSDHFEDELRWLRAQSNLQLAALDEARDDLVHLSRSPRSGFADRGRAGLARLDGDAP